MYNGGQVYEDNFKDGKRHGEFKTTNSDREATSEYYENGKLIL